MNTLNPKTFVARGAFLLGVFVLVACSVQGGPANPSPAITAPSAPPVAPNKLSRKLIEIGWDIPGATFVHDNIRSMEEKPFQGVVMSINEVGLRPDGYPDNLKAPLAFDPRAWTEAEMKLEVLSGIQWGTFTDNFFWLLATNYKGMDWFDDAHWQTIQANMRLLGRAINAGRLKGVFFDPENYGYNPWAYSAALYPSQSFAQVEAKVRQRAAQFIGALQAEVPNVTFMAMMLSDLIHDAYDNHDGAIEKDEYALLKAFLEGLLDGMGNGVKLVEGNEGAYYFDDTRKFVMGHDWIRWIENLLTPERLERYRAQATLANAVYPDLVYGLMPKTNRDGAEITFRPNYYDSLTPTEFRQWWQHNLYHALSTSQEYVWMWNEEMNWWQNRLPAGLEDSLREVLERFDRLEPIGFDMAIQGDLWRRDRQKPAFVTSPSITVNVSRNGSNVRVDAEVTGNAASVEFFAGSRKLGSDDTAPFSWEGTLEPRDEVIIARVFDGDRHGTSAPVLVTGTSK